VGPLRIVKVSQGMDGSRQAPLAEGSQTGRPRWILYLLLWLAGVQLRSTILAMPPVLPAIHSEFDLSATQVGLLASLPSALFALAALPGALLIARLGAKAALVGGLLMTALGAALRGASSGWLGLFATTILMCAGVAVMQPTMSVLVRDWVPRRVGFATALYSNGLLFGEFLPVWVTVPFILPAVGGSWRAELAVWSLPVVATLVAVLLLAPGRHAGPVRDLAHRRWMPDWKQSLIWVMGLLFGSINGIYFSTNFFLPDYLNSFGRGDQIGPALTALNFAQIPASLLLLWAAHKVERRAWPYVVLAALDTVGVLGLAFAVGPLTPLWSALIGFATSGAMILALTLPVLLSAPHDVARNSAGMFTLSYGTGVLVAIASGVCWDWSGIPALAFLPIGICTLTLSGAALIMRWRGQLR
jgi:MFS transporter, CP family, cyanate transporter